ncbi:hypothetical protein Leryth_007567 [Lithospermum erythrorhizon]|nr:hypothetical protein Leryth_007567 [Lithospermum erythrorhizon]
MSTKKSYQWLGGSERVNPINSASEFELDEADIWGTNNTETLSETKRTSNNMKPLKKPIKKSNNNHIDHVHQRPNVATSLPVNVPDWSKILGNEYKGRVVDEDEDVGIEVSPSNLITYQPRGSWAGRYNDEYEEDDKDHRIPPHVYLARTRGASFSVHEGIGRTLKGRDLSRVRNAIWKKTGFED